MQFPGLEVHAAAKYRIMEYEVLRGQNCCETEQQDVITSCEALLSVAANSNAAEAQAWGMSCSSC